MREFGRGYEPPRRPEAGDCPHGNKEATCPECLEDIKAFAKSLEVGSEPEEVVLSDEDIVPIEPRRPETGDCPHGNKEATCPECLKDVEAAAESLKKSRERRPSAFEEETEDEVQSNVRAMAEAYRKDAKKEKK